MKLRRLTIACASVIMLSPAQAAPGWECAEKPNGGWDCLAQDLPPAPAKKPTTEVAPLREPARFEPEPLLEEQEPDLEEPVPALAPEDDPWKRFDEPAQRPILAAPVVAAPEQEPIYTYEAIATPEPAPAVTSAIVKTKPKLVTNRIDGDTPAAVLEALAQAPAEFQTDEIGGYVDSTAPIAAEADARLSTPEPTSPLALNAVPWSCGPVPGAAQPSVDTAAREAANMQISADSIDSESESLFNLNGNVRAQRADQNMAADSARYDQASQQMDLQGNVQYRDAAIVIDGATASMNLGSDQATLEQLSYRLLDANARGEAGSAELHDRNRSSFENISYTTCQPGNSDWILRADTLEADRESGIGVARNATVRFKGVPIAWTPYLSFPLDDRRKTGVLTPSFGYSDELGVDVAVPYYINLAPQYDATLTPRVLTNRGLMLGAEFRYLQPAFEGEIEGEILPDDDDFNGENRSIVHLEHRQRFGQRLTLNVIASNASDDEYLDDFGDSLSSTSTRHLLRRADLHYQGEGWSLLGRADDYQTLDDPFALVNEPYSRLPQVLATVNERDLAGGLTFSGIAEYVMFDADDRVDGSRFDIRPELALPVTRSWGYIRPAIAGRYTTYDLDNQTAGLDDNPDRALFTGSLDTGLTFDRQTTFAGSAVTQTLEPRLYYLYTPFEDQSDIPLFDTAEYDLSFPTLFTDNRFSSTDRVGDANQVTLAMTTRIIDDAGGNEWLRASLGQTFFFRDRKVNLAGNTVVDTDSSNVIGEVKARLSDEWSVRSAVQWDPHDSEVDRGAIGLRYAADRSLLNLGYRYRRDVLDQADISGRVPLANAWTAVGRWNYSFDDSVLLEGFAGIEYDSCCWSTRLVARRYITDNGTEHNNGVLLQIELKGLARLGDRVDKFLERGIYGYEVDD